MAKLQISGFYIEWGNVKNTPQNSSTYLWHLISSKQQYGKYLSFSISMKILVECVCGKMDSEDLTNVITHWCNVWKFSTSLNLMTQKCLWVIVVNINPLSIDTFFVGITIVMITRRFWNAEVAYSCEIHRS